MKLINRLITSLLFTLLPSLLFSTDYNASDTQNWSVYDNTPTGAIIENSYDNEIKSVIFKGDGQKNAYLIGDRKSSKGWNNKENILQWKMNFAEKYRLTLYTQTSKGLRIFKYDYKKRDKGLYKKRHIHIGLGKSSKDGTWRAYQRNIQADLKKYEPDNKLITINGLKVQGSGKVEYIRLIGQSNGEEQQLIEKAKEHCQDKDNSTQKVLCSNEPNIVYIINEKEKSDIIYFTLHKVSIEPNHTSVTLLREYSRNSWEYVPPPKDESFIKLADTPIYIVKSVTQEADQRGGFNFFYKEERILSFGFTENDGYLNDIKTFDNGKKLTLSYTYHGEGYSEWNVKEEGHYTKVYDISNPALPKLISSKREPL